MDSDEEQTKANMNRRAVRFGSIAGHIAGILLFVVPLRWTGAHLYLWTDATLRIANFSPRFVSIIYVGLFFATFLILPGYTSWISYRRNFLWSIVPLSRLALWFIVASDANDLMYANGEVHREYTVLEDFLFDTLESFIVSCMVGYLTWLISTIVVHSVGEWIVIRQTINRQSQNDDSHTAI